VCIVFLGAPGAGKGTQAVRVAQELGLVHIASGDLFRQAVSRGDELGLKVKNYMEKGMLVPDEVTIGMILEKVSQSRGGIILDGFPRNLGQAEALNEAFRKRNMIIDKVVYIKVPETELVRRLSGRWLCRNCQMPYNRQSSPPKVWNRCDRCGGELYQRPDDRPETVKKRLKIYFNETAALVEYYRQRGKLLEVDGEGSVEKVTRRIIRNLNRREIIAG
jgi:adenylate kinase